MLAVHFGAGNIGRGFIGALLYQSSFHTLFVDVNGKVIDEINRKQKYDVVLADEKKEVLTVRNISGINSMIDSEKVVQAIVNADLITTAVGPNVLELISELVAKGLQERLHKNPKPINVIACENMVGGSDILKEHVYKHIAEKDHGELNSLVGFPNAAVDRIVPNQMNHDRLEVLVEPYFEWVVEKTAFKGKIPEITGITYVDDLKPYIERKLFTVNTGHAVPAYIGHLMGYHTIYEAMQDRSVLEILEGALGESGEAIIQTYGFNRAVHQEYVSKIINRFKNPHISDDVARVSRGPIRKLGPNDRLIQPAKMYWEITGKSPIMLAKVIAAALMYSHEMDREAVELQQLIEKQGYRHALERISGLKSDHALVPIIMKEMENINAYIRG
ncbi:mannitol-1-phosphate 5-dehydrogenase [Ornithinibacillus bavariensis]|uniref:mannitol-1-phosphate 5-dehydrogenase n=1 Tax=Ornithinibacillus bavariensis TaxID=545502 RepID=UPI000EDC4782|nr:mannitol-1-phosphate 5-dehydrogenase [Ornithinibacillus sp.]